MCFGPDREIRAGSAVCYGIGFTNHHGAVSTIGSFKSKPKAIGRGCTRLIGDIEDPPAVTQLVTVGRGIDENGLVRGIRSRRRFLIHICLQNPPSTYFVGIVREIGIFGDEGKIGRIGIRFHYRTGSGNETSAHIRAGGPMTIMFCAFEGPPLILRLYGQGTVLARGSAGYDELLASTYGGAGPTGARQIIRLDVELVKTSCGYGVPFFDYVGERDQIDRWNDSKGEEGLVAYRQQKNLVSMDGLPTGFVENAAEPAE